MDPVPKLDVTLRLMPGPQWGVLSIDGDIEALLGFHPNRFLDGVVSIAALIHPDDQDIVEAMLACQPDARRQVCNLRMRQANQRIRCLLAEYALTPAQDGHEPELRLRLRDAKSLFRDQAALVESASFRAMMDNTNDFIFFKDRNHVFTGASQTLVRVTDPSQHWTDLIGQTDYDVFPEAYADVYYRLEKQVFAGIAVAHEVQEFQTKDGLKGWVDNRKYPIRNAQGEINGLFGIARVITDRIEAEQALLLERDSTRNILATVEAMIVALDTEGRITLVNRKGCQILGYSEDELIGRDWFATCLPHSIDLDQVRAVFKMALAGDRSGSEYFENPVRTRNGQERLIAWHNSIIRDRDGNSIGGLSAGEDITDRKQAERALQASEEKYRELVDHANSIILKWNRHGEIQFLNEFGQRFFGFTEAEIIGKQIIGSIVPAVDEAGSDLSRLMQEIFGNPQQYAQNINENRCKDGTRAWIAWQNRPILDAAGQISEMLSVGSDFTELRTTQLELQRRERYQRALLDNFPFMVWLKDMDSRLLAANQAFADAAGQTLPEDITGKSDHDLFTTELAELYRADDLEVIKSGKPKSIEELINIGGRTVWSETYKSPVFLDGKIIGTVGFARDISERKAHQKQLEHIAHYDILTGLPNRVLLADRLHQALVQTQRHKKMLAVAYLDLDGFKTINDQYGHEVGDRLLTTLASHMKLALREGDTLARLGGDEFVAVILDLPDIESCVPMLSRLLAAAAEVVHDHGNALRVSASLGVTFFPQADAIDADQLLRQADQAMYQAKLAGKNRYHIFDTEQDRSVRGHHESLERIRQAVDEREFVLHYQPKVNMRTGVITGAEALIRWLHPQRDLLPPAAFLPLIADDRLSIDLGEWVLDTAMTQIETWKLAGLHVPVSVNIDAIQLEQADFVDRLRRQLARHPHVAPGDLELEVLETSALEDIAHVSSVILACREMGVGFALDDFGTGYSSLTYLKRLPAGMLKIDQSFVRDMLDDPDDLAILDGVLGLASAFRRQAIAEGVETLAHGEILLQLGCELGQGYAIARPMPAAAMPDWLAAWRPDASWLNRKPISRDDLPILFTWVEHRAWIAQVVSFLRSERDAPPPLQPDECRFGHWLRHDALLRHEDDAVLKAIVPLHIEVHALASTLIGLKQDGRNDAALAQLEVLFRWRDSLLAQLLKMLR